LFSNTLIISTIRRDTGRGSGAGGS